MKVYGLVGKNIDYSFSKKYFTERFENTNAIDCEYRNFDIATIDDFCALTKNNPDIAGLNVTIPYKESVIPFLDSLSKKAAAIGAVNVIRFKKNGHLKGYNSDYFGFKKAIKPLLQPHHKKALILGTGGSSKAVAFALSELDISYTFVSRDPAKSAVTYDRINETTFENFQIIINCTPLGTTPNISEFPPIPFQYLTKRHIAFDLIYNPVESTFLKKARLKGVTTINGLNMLVYQAEKAWKIWNK